MSARPRAAPAVASGLARGLERMIRIQMEAAPAHWREDERRAWAVQLLFGKSCQ